MGSSKMKKFGFSNETYSEPTTYVTLFQVCISVSQFEEVKLKGVYYYPYLANGIIFKTPPIDIKGLSGLVFPSEIQSLDSLVFEESPRDNARGKLMGLKIKGFTEGQTGFLTVQRMEQASDGKVQPRSKVVVVGAPQFGYPDLSGKCDGGQDVADNILNVENVTIMFGICHLMNTSGTVDFDLKRLSIQDQNPELSSLEREAKFPGNAGELRAKIKKNVTRHNALDTFEISTPWATYLIRSIGGEMSRQWSIETNYSNPTIKSWIENINILDRQREIASLRITGIPLLCIKFHGFLYQ